MNKKNTNNNDDGMTFWTWVLVGAVLLFTLGGTWSLTALTSSMAGVALLLRQAASVLFTDGALLYWHFQKDKYPTGKQRQIARFMMWEALVIVLAFTLVYMLLSVMGVTWSGARLEVHFAGYPFEASVTEWLDVLVSFLLGAQAVGTLTAVLYIATLSPQAQMTLRAKEAEQEVIERQLEDYEVAQRAIAPIVGQAQAISALRAELTALGYTEREREGLVGLALECIRDSRANPPVALKVVPKPDNCQVSAAVEEVCEAAPFRSNGNGRKP